MNGEIVREQTQGRPLRRRRRSIAGLAPDDRKAVEVAYLAVLTRRPTAGGIGPLRRPARGHRRATSGSSGSATSSGR